MVAVIEQVDESLGNQAGRAVSISPTLRNRLETLDKVVVVHTILESLK